MRQVEPGTSRYTMAERWGSAIAHTSALLIGVPLTVFLLPIPLSFVPCPVVAYLIARSFRRRKLSWGAFQGMQASLVQVLLVVLAAAAAVSDALPRLMLTFGTMGFLLLLYSLWAAFDTLLGYDFHYIGISNLLDRVSRANLSRPERRRRWFGGRRSDSIDGGH